MGGGEGGRREGIDKINTNKLSETPDSRAYKGMVCLKSSTSLKLCSFYHNSTDGVIFKPARGDPAVGCSTKKGKEYKIWNQVLPEMLKKPYQLKMFCFVITVCNCM